MKRPILFVDFFGTLSSGKFWSSLDEKKHPWHGRRKTVEAFLFRDNAELAQDWMRGKYSSEYVHQVIADGLNLNFNTLFKAFKEDCKKLLIPDNFLNHIDVLKKKYYVILSTDNMDSFDRFTLPVQPRIREVFDDVHNSFNCGMLKLDRDGAYFKKALSDYGVDFKDCVLIDDAEATCALFERLGGQSIRFKSEEEFMQALRTLA